MANISPAHQLYLYQLLVREIGTGRQTMLSRVEEVLAADDVMPQDVSCESARELLESLGDWARITVFKKGRVYVTFAPWPEGDQMLERVQKQPTTGGSGPKAWKRKKSGKVVRPVKPQPRNRPVEERPESADPEPVVELQVEPVVAEKTMAEPEPVAEPEPAPEPEVEMAPTPEPTPEPEPEASTPMPVPTPTPEPPSIRFSITYDPYELVADLPPEPEPIPDLVPVVTEPNPPVAPQPIYPQSFVDEVVCGDEVLSALCQVLPLDVDPIALLDEDWRVARSADDFVREQGSIRFPLRYLRTSDGAPLEVRMRRKGASPSGRRWELVSVGDEPEDLSSVGFEGLPTADEGAWSDLLGGRPTLVSPARSFAQCVATGPWETLLDELATLARPEPWGEGRWALREYLFVTFARIACEDKLAVSDDRQRAAFDTGLLTLEDEPIRMALVARDDDIPWSFAGFRTHVDGLDPQPASYVLSLDTVALVDAEAIELDRRLARHCPRGLEAAVGKSAAAARRSYRLSTPAYDPQANEMRLLLPVTLAGEVRAIVLATRPGGGHVVRSVLSLERACACARVVSAELPSWLAPR